jgi:chromosome segregation ATPase
MAKFEGDPEEANADMTRASDAVGRADDAVTEAEARLEALEHEEWDGTPEGEADLSRRVNEADREVERLKVLRAEAEDELGQRQAFWEQQGY